MTIDFEIYLNCPDMLDTVVTNIRNFVQETLGEEMKIYNAPPSKEDEFIDINCSLYQVSVTSIEWQSASLWLGEDYNVDVTVYIIFWFYSGGDDVLRSRHVLRLFLVLSRLYPGDAILMDIGDEVIYRKNGAGLYMDDGKGRNEDYYVKLFEREWKRKRDGVSLPFRLQTPAFPAGEDCLSIDFDKGYELLTVFLVFEAVNAYPTIYKALTAVLNQRSDCKEIGLNVCSLEIHPDTTKIMDDLARNGERRFCEIATEELLLFIQIGADELDMRLRRISREELKAELDEIEKEQRRKYLEELKAEENKVREQEMPKLKKNERSKWNFFWKKLWKAKDEKEPQEIKPQEIEPQKIEEQEIEPQESEGQENEGQESVVAYRNSGVYAIAAEIAGIPERADGNYPTLFPEELNRQEIADIIHEAYDNKVCIIENAYMGRAKKGMKIALFLNDAGKILRAFPLY